MTIHPAINALHEGILSEFPAISARPNTFHGFDYGSAPRGPGERRPWIRLSAECADGDERYALHGFRGNALEWTVEFSGPTPILVALAAVLVAFTRHTGVVGASVAS